MFWLGVAAKALGIYQGWKAEREQAKAVGRQMAEQATNAIRSMNYAFQNYEQERKDAFDAAVANLEKMQINARGLQGSVNNAVSEDMSDSVSGRLLSRSVHAEAMRAALSEKMNYTRKSNEIDLNKEQQLLYTKSYTAGLHPPSVPSAMNLFHRFAMGAVEMYGQQQNLEHFRQMNGYYNNKKEVVPKYTYKQAQVQEYNWNSNALASMGSVSTVVRAPYLNHLMIK